ncbi:TPA: helix-turn-helix transcriptional regulator [Listeria monocytogenes]|uniref:helix-turn-helix domain-containing protein n=1 Tax=Listeria monocytogenes TaxID=1639 RepID=UPI00076F40A2|nr:helix-turn-helix transcriptional regulator [Listeria monocytogenes]EAG8534375.1 XRE family transcriptional regulator [Listeria innocua]EAD2414464.1 XRE family transcriptional regulator [Listeria monocytogenes]EAD5992142.1 XRE family transcriptional regulator [Listeria monocytogenes]EAE5012287.1 XRE family transcriptional regulator [Listeria monocytogenes]EAG4975537.1 XRE family transcriptional regulator [Listeria monocytogenes]
MTTFERVKVLAEKQKISLKELALKLNMGENAIYSWKVKTPGADKLKAVADYFNVSTDYLLGRTDNPQIGKDITEEVVTLAAHIDPSATEEDMKKILEYIDFIQQKYK